MWQPSLPSELSYAPKPALRHTALGRRILVGGVLVIVPMMLFLGAHIPFVRMRVDRFRYYLHMRGPQNAALSYSAPAKQIVYSNDPADVPLLLGSGRYKSFVNPLHRADALLRNQQFDDLIAAQSRPGVIAAPAVFLHARQLPGGAEVIAAVQMTDASGDDGQIFLYPYAQPITRPVSMGRMPRFVPMQLVIHRSAGDIVRIFDGQPDPIDPARLTIRIDMSGRSFTLVGQINPNGTFFLLPNAGKLAWIGDDFQWLPPGEKVPGYTAPEAFVDLPGRPVHYTGFFSPLASGIKSDDQSFPAPTTTTCACGDP